MGREYPFIETTKASRFRWGGNCDHQDILPVLLGILFSREFF
jgi:hypothetical protein